MTNELVAISQPKYICEKGHIQTGFGVQIRVEDEDPTDFWLRLRALEKAAEAQCSLRCPNVKRTGTEWTHVDECRASSEALRQWREARK